jgi:plasmid stability protein
VPVNLSIKNAPDEVVQKLRERAARNHRSLQGELLAIIEAAVERPKGRPWTAQEVLDHVRTLNLPQVNEAADIVRADRDRGHRDKGC